MEFEIIIYIVLFIIITFFFLPGKRKKIIGQRMKFEKNIFSLWAVFVFTSAILPIRSLGEFCLYHNMHYSSGISKFIKEKTQKILYYRCL